VPHYYVQCSCFCVVLLEFARIVHALSVVTLSCFSWFWFRVFVLLLVMHENLPLAAVLEEGKECGVNSSR